MPVQLRVMSWNIQKRTTIAPYVAELMRLYQIDICALLEMPNSNVATTLAQIVADLNNLAVAYHQNEWSWQAVNVGDEAVGYVWHQNNSVSGNAFQVDLMANGGARVFGAVTRNAANQPIYFPDTGSNWTSMPGTPNGRRPAFLGFATNDGAAARRFTVLDIHSPFDKSSSIQSYGASLLATSREITWVDRTDLPAIAAQAGVGLALLLAATVNPIINQMSDHAYVNTATLCGGAVAEAIAATDGSEINLQTLIRAIGRASVRGALGTFIVKQTIDETDAQCLATAVAVAAAGAAAMVVASARLPTAPLVATAAAARTTAMTAAENVVGQLQLPVKRIKSTVSSVQITVRLEAERIVALALAPFAFSALPQTPVTASIVAGDFNVRYPDNIVYKAAQEVQMGGGGANAYTRLLALGVGATNTERSTRIGPTAFRGQLVYSYVNGRVQWGDNLGVDYVPLNMQALVANQTAFMNWTSWSTQISTMAKNQGLVWVGLQKTYGALINGAFDKETNNDARFYRANVYDNIFVRGGTVTANHGVIDVISELGSWPAAPNAFINPAPGIVPNPWAAARAGLNALAQTAMAALPLNYTYNGVPYAITAALADGIEAAVFLDKYISDHLPVYAEVQI